MIIYDIASLLLIGVSHIYLFNLLIGFKKMPISLFVIIGVLFTIFLTMSVTFSGLVELNLILLFSFLMLIGFMSKRAKLTHTIYFSLLSIVMYTVIKNGLYALVYQVYLDSPFNYYVWTPSILQFATLLFIWVMMYLAKGKIQLVGNYLRESKLFISTFILIMICTTLLFIVNYPSSTVLADINMRYGEHTLYFVCLLVLCMN